MPKQYLRYKTLKKESLKAIWLGKAFNNFRSYMKIGCSGCKAKIKCNKCIAQSFRYFNRGDMPTPYCIRNGENLGLNKLDELKKCLYKEHNIKL